MKAMKLSLVIIITLFTVNISAQTGKLKSDSVKVAGNCGMCKARIEKAALSGGAATASWSSGTRLLTLSFDPYKTNTDDLAKKVSASGHDTEKFKAEEKVYNSLPGCCKYDRTNLSESSKQMDHKDHSHN
jgi:hypothetical protein